MHTRMKWSGAVLAVAAAAGFSGAAADPATAKVKRCGSPVVANPLGGYGLILQDLRVNAVTCKTGERIAGRAIVGRKTAGWTCRPVKGSVGRQVCRKRKLSVAYTFGGDAG